MGCVDMSAERLHQVNVCERAKNGIHNPRPQSKRFVVRRTRRERAGQARNGRAVAGRAPQRLRTAGGLQLCLLVICLVTIGVNILASRHILSNPTLHICD